MNGIKRIILSSLAVVLALVALGTTTYAWFTVTEAVKIDPIQMQLESVDDLELAVLSVNINVDQENGPVYFTEEDLTNNVAGAWRKTIKLSEIKEAFKNFTETVDFDTLVLSNITSADALSFSKINTGYTFDQDIVTKSSMLEFPIYFRTSTNHTLIGEGEEQTKKYNSVYVHNSTVKLAGGSSDEQNIFTSTVDGKQIKADISSAFRLAFVQYNKFLTPETGDSVLGSKIFEKLNGNTGSPEPGSELALAKTAGATFKGSISTPQNIDNNDGLWYFNSKNKREDAYIAEFGDGSDAENSINFAGYTSQMVYDLQHRIEDIEQPSVIEFNDSIDDGVSTSGSSVSYKYARANFKLWLEGWDRDTFDFIQNKKFEIFLSFSTTAKGDEN